MNRRGLLGALLSMGFAGTAVAAMPRLQLPEEMPTSDELTRDPMIEADEPDMVQDVQYRGRHRRCRWETRQVRYRDRWGRVRFRTVRREVCW